MINSPFKFLDSYTCEDRAIFFGRDQEKAQSTGFAGRSWTKYSEGMAQSKGNRAIRNGRVGDGGRG